MLTVIKSNLIFNTKFLNTILKVYICQKKYRFDQSKTIQRQ